MKRLYFLISFCLIHLHVCCAPRLTVIFVVDQFAHHYLDRLMPYMTGGIKELMERGVVYQNAYFPHAMPSTGTGHAALNTGCFAKDHGIISNKWFDAKGNLVRCDDDSAQNAAVFGKDGKLLDYGKSAKNMIVEGISDQIVLHRRPRGNNKVFSLSYKSRSAIGAAGDLGKAIWFDNTTGRFTSSKAYFEKLPEWITNFNKEKKIYKPRKITWSLLYPNKNGAYNAKNAKSYKFTTFKKSLIDTPISIPDPNNKEEPYELFCFLPESDNVLLDLALKCIDENLSTNKKNQLVMWVSLSATDKLGHRFGPNSREMFDLIYRLDKQIKRFMNKVDSRIKKKDTLFVLTADHGVAPIPELVHQEGIKSAVRINEKELIKKLNAVVKEKHDIENLIYNYKTPCFYVDKKMCQNLTEEQRKPIIETVKEALKKEPGIKDAWSRCELLEKNFPKTDIVSFYKNQIYPERSGEFIIQMLPFCQTSKYSGGTSHRTPYEHNTHVPLVLYQKNLIENRKIGKRVSMLQLPNTIAYILGVPRAPASTCTILPNLFSQT